MLVDFKYTGPQTSTRYGKTNLFMLCYRQAVIYYSFLDIDIFFLVVLCSQFINKMNVRFVKFMVINGVPAFNLFYLNVELRPNKTTANLLTIASGLFADRTGSSVCARHENTASC